MFKFREFNLPFISFLSFDRKQYLALVDNISEDSISYHTTQGKNIENINSFFSKYTGLSLLFFIDNKHDNSKQDRWLISFLNTFIYLIKSNYIALVFTILIFLIAAYFSSVTGNFVNILIFALKVCGLLISYSLIAHKFNQDSSFVSSFCHSNKSDCEFVIDNDASNKFLNIIDWSYLGLLYFMGTTFYLFLECNDFTNTISVLFYFNIPCIVFSIYSLWYQMVKTKKYCYFCLGTLVVFFLEFVALSYHYNFLLPRFNFLSLSICFTAGALVLFVMINYFNSRQQYYKYRERFNDIKYDLHTFNGLLASEEIFEFGNYDDILRFGNYNSINEITLITNPFCAPCIQVHQQIEELLSENDNFLINILFSVSPSKDNKSPRYKIAKTIVQLYKDKGRDYAYKALNKWYLNQTSYNYNYETWKSIIDLNNEYDDNYNNDHIDKILLDYENLCDANMIKYTPTVFFNGYRLPRFYNVTDLKYLI